MTLLEKAKETEPRNRNKTATPLMREQEQLAVAYAKGELTSGQVAAAIKANPNSAAGLMAGMLIRGIRAGRIEVRIK